MSRHFAYPLLTLALMLMWLLLGQSFTLGALLLALLASIFAVRLFTALGAERPRIRLGMAIPRLALIVLTDIIRSNIAVARIIWGGRQPRRMSGFVHMPIEMRNRHGIALLAIIITATPGTLWVQFDSGRGRLLIHVLDLVDEEQWITLIKGRYERLLMEIFP